MAAALAGCAVAPYDSGYDSRSSYRAVYLGGIYSGTTIHRHGEGYRAFPRHRHGYDASSRRSHSGHQGVTHQPDPIEPSRVAGDLRNWRDGDGAFRRQKRTLDRVGLEQRQRLDRQERVRQDRQDRADRSRVSRGTGQVVLPGSSDPGISEKFDQDVGRRMERSTQAERQAQRRAAEVRRQLKAERRSEREGGPAIPPVSAARVQRGG
jgi:hypothetical protein